MDIASTAQCADACQIHAETLRRFLRMPNSPLEQGVHYSWAGQGKGKLQWNVPLTQKALWEYKRQPAEEVETFSRTADPVTR